MNPAPFLAADDAFRPASRELLARAADALQSYAGEVEQLGEILCSQEALIERHLDQLQSIDRLSQCLSQLALVLRAPAPDRAVAAITISILQDQLTQSPTAESEAHRAQ